MFIYTLMQQSMSITVHNLCHVMCEDQSQCSTGIRVRVEDAAAQCVVCSLLHTHDVGMWLFCNFQFRAAVAVIVNYDNSLRLLKIGEGEGNSSDRISEAQ